MFAPLPLPLPLRRRAVETQSFDSTHNVHVPALVMSLVPYKVLEVGCGGGHTLVVAERRANPGSPGGRWAMGECINPSRAGGGGERLHSLHVLFFKYYIMETFALHVPTCRGV